MTFSVSPFRAPAWKPFALVSAISALFAVPVYGQAEEDKTLAPVVVTASRIEQSQAEALPTTTVITAQDIRNSQASDLPSLLKTQAGIEISQNGGAGSTTSLFMRGTESRHNLVLIDGVPIRDATELGTAAALQNIHPDQIERIEIVRGNVSAIYGSGAIGGVIQIFTKQGKGEPAITLSSEVGSRGTTKVSGGVSGKTGDTRYMLSATRYETDGFSSMNTKQDPSQNPDKDGNRNVSVSAMLSHEWSRGHELGLNIYANDSKYDFDGGGATTSREDGESRQRTFAVFSKNRFTQNWLSKMTFSEADAKRDTTSQGGGYGGAYDYDSRYKSKIDLLQWTNEVMLTSNWMVTAGMDVGREKADVYSYSPNSFPTPTLTQYDHSRSTYSAYAGLNGKYEAHSIQVNVRQDHVDAVGSEATGYLGYGYALTPAWKLIASTSTAFLAPNLYQLYDSINGNANLKAERARSKEAGIQYASGQTIIRTVFFETHTNDLIDWVRTGTGYDWSGKYFNVDRASNEGMELSARSRIADTDMRASLTLQSPKDETTGDALSKRAKTLASFGASKSLGAWRVGGDVQYVGHRPDGTHELPSYVLANLNARYQVSKQVSLYGRIENLFDRDYQTAYGYNQAGRGYFAGIEWRQ